MCAALSRFSETAKGDGPFCDEAATGYLACALLLALMADPASSEPRAGAALVAEAARSPQLSRAVMHPVTLFEREQPSAVRAGGDALPHAPQLLLAALCSAAAAAGAEGAALLRRVAEEVSPVQPQGHLRVPH